MSTGRPFGGELGDPAQSGRAVTGLADDVDVRLRRQDHVQAGPDEGLVVDDEDSHTGQCS
jgi:hypothetical protein